ncbi:FAD-dependent monooxygenase [Micromonospora sp. NPDC047557]|uniref:FAD-dependent monooxygenase n=1 Tax=Micromonospora sp. NPDC047557 TaxID=3364250 RepID=UPI00371AC081
MKDDTVLVVGAGPVGLVLACDLLQQGIPVRLVDAERQATPHSRANVLWPRNLELLHRIGVTDDLLARGHRIRGTRYFSQRRPLGEVSLRRLGDTPYPFALMIAQSTTEEVLRDRLAALGGRIDRGVRLVDIDPSGGLPRVKLEHPDGTVEERTFEWLVGADGAHSAVRKRLGIGFSGEPVDVTFAIADAGVRTDLPDDLSYYFYSDRGGLALGPLGGGLFRLATTVPHQPEDAAAPGRDLFQSVVDERMPGVNVVGDLVWSTTFRVRCRIAETFRAGRCLLAGDAAHIVSPAGGQGMNTGIQDAVNLGWRLGAVVRGRSPEEALDAYEKERRTAAHRVAATTAVQTRFAIAGRSRLRLAARDTVARLAHRTGVLQRYLAPQLSQLDVSYGEPRPLVRRGGPARPGERLPVLPGPGPAALDGPWPLVARDDFTVVVWRGDTSPPGLPDGTSVVRTGPGAVTRQLAEALGRQPVLAVIRPDGHLLGSAPLDDSAAVARLVAVL